MGQAWAKIFDPKPEKTRFNPKIAHKNPNPTRPDHVTGWAWVKKSDLIVGMGRAWANFFDPKSKRTQPELDPTQQMIKTTKL